MAFVGFKDIPYEKNARDILPIPFEIVIEECVFDVSIHPRDLNEFESVVMRYLRQNIIGTNQVYGMILDVVEVLDASPPLFQCGKPGDPNARASVKVRAKVAKLTEGNLLIGCENPKITEEQATYTYGEDGFIVATVPFIDDQKIRALVTSHKKVDLLVETLRANNGEKKIYAVAKPFIYDNVPMIKRATTLSKPEIVIKPTDIKPLIKRVLIPIDDIDAAKIEIDEPQFNFGDVRKEISYVFDIAEKFDVDTTAEQSRLYIPVFRAIAEKIPVYVFELTHIDNVGIAHLLGLLALYYRECYIYIPFALDPLSGIRYVVCKDFRGKNDIATKIYNAMVDAEKKNPEAYLYTLFTNMNENDVKVIVYHNMIYSKIQALERLLPQPDTEEFEIRMTRNKKLWSDSVGKSA